MLLCISSKAQNCIIQHSPFQGGEQLNYDVYYQLKKVWVQAGKARFSVKDSVVNGQKCFHFEGKGKSLKSYDWFFKVRDHYASLARKRTLVPVRFVRKVNEGGFSLYYDYHFDPENEKADVYLNPKDTVSHLEIDVPRCSFDVMTAVYYARTLDFTGMKEGDTIPMRFMVDKQIYDVHIRYTGKEVIKTLNKEKYKCIKFRPLLIEGTIFEEGEFMEVYVTDDKNRIPIYVEAQILVGTVKAYITSMKRVKYPLTSKLN